MRVDIVWDDHRWPTQEIKLSWWLGHGEEPADLAMEEAPAIYSCELERNEQLQEEIELRITLGYFEPEVPHQVIELCGMHDRPDYMGTVRWYVVAETPEEQAWLESFGYTAPTQVAQALDAIQKHRLSIGQRPLDVVQAGWLPRDILAEAERLRRTPNPHESVMLPEEQQALANAVFEYFARNKHRRVPVADASRHFGALTRPIEQTLQAYGVLERPRRGQFRWPYVLRPDAWRLQGSTLVPAKTSRKRRTAARNNPPAISLPAGATLFHGSLEPLEGTLRPGGYDEVLWFAEQPGIAQLYIARSGITMYVPSGNIARPSKDSDVQSIQRLIGLEYDLAEVRWDRMGRRPQSYRVPAAWDHLQPSEITAEAEMRIEALGYQPMRSAPRGMRSYEFHIADGKILAPGGVQQGSLCVARTLREMLLWPKARGEGDLTDLQYHDVEGFQAARKAGYDGVIIDDFAQSEAWGNFGHLSVGLFAEAVADLQIECIPATYEEWERDRVGTKAYPHPPTTSFTALLGTVSDVDLPGAPRGNPEDTFASLMTWAPRR